MIEVKTETCIFAEPRPRQLAIDLLKPYFFDVNQKFNKAYLNRHLAKRGYKKMFKFEKKILVCSNLSVK